MNSNNGMEDKGSDPWKSFGLDSSFMPGDVHVWRADFDQAGVDTRFLNCLSADERRRAGQYRNEQGRRHFVLGRAILRDILSRYMHQSPKDIEITYGEAGKPAVAGFQAGSPLEFNLSHSAGLALYGFSANIRIGVDLEKIREMLDRDAIVRRFFCESEAAAYFRLAPQEREGAFFRSWTRKEAVLKALGDGLTRSLRSIEVTLSPGEAPRLLSVSARALDARSWTLADLAPAEGYAAALAAQGPIEAITCYDWNMSV